VDRSVDQLFNDQSIAITGIYRAKGNEAPMVYVLNSEYGYEGAELIKRRNGLFTAITRSRAWVRLCGCGSSMEKLEQEMNKVVANQYQLSFKVPTAEELSRLRSIHRDLTPDERAKRRSVEKGLSDFVEMMDRGELSLENLPSTLRTAYLSLFPREMSTTPNETAKEIRTLVTALVQNGIAIDTNPAVLHRGAGTVLVSWPSNPVQQSLNLTSFATLLSTSIS
jgi:hypothetical protein